MYGFRAGPDPLGGRRIPTAGCDEGGVLGQVWMVPRRAGRCGWFRFHTGPDRLGEKRIRTAGCDEGGALGQVWMVPGRARPLRRE